jgi:hypothetical protein
MRCRFTTLDPEWPTVNLRDVIDGGMARGPRRSEGDVVTILNQAGYGPFDSISLMIAIDWKDLP